MNESCLILTATINPCGMQQAKRSDIHSREQDYLKALQYYSKFNISLVFCENSNSNLDKLKSVVNYTDRDIEFFGFDGNDYPKEKGKGFGEIGILKNAFEKSQIIKKSRYIIKITGRLSIMNLAKILHRIDSHKITTPDIFCNFRSNLALADSRFFIAKKEFYPDYLFLFHDLINDSSGIYFEHALSRAIHLALSEGMNWLPMPLPPVIKGYYGTRNAKYKTGLVRRMNKHIRHYILKYSYRY